MRTRTTTLGVLFATTTAVVWGGQFVVGKSALESIDAFPLTTIRYAFAAGLWLIVLALLEGPRSLRLDGRGWRLFWLGSLGFAGFNLLAYTGLAHARPQSASLIVAVIVARPVKPVGASSSAVHSPLANTAPAAVLRCSSTIEPSSQATTISASHSAVS